MVYGITQVTRARHVSEVRNVIISHYRMHLRPIPGPSLRAAALHLLYDLLAVD